MTTQAVAPAILYDREADALTLELLSDAPVKRTVTVTKGVYADLDSKGRIIALEVLNASRYFPQKTLQRLTETAQSLTLTEAAKHSGISAATLRKQIHNHRLRATKRGRDWMVTAHELANYVAKYSRPKRSIVFQAA